MGLAAESIDALEHVHGDEHLVDVDESGVTLEARIAYVAAHQKAAIDHLLEEITDNVCTARPTSTELQLAILTALSGDEVVDLFENDVLLVDAKYARNHEICAIADAASNFMKAVLTVIRKAHRPAVTERLARQLDAEEIAHLISEGFAE
jgi:hypothetical protein